MKLDVNVARIHTLEHPKLNEPHDFFVPPRLVGIDLGFGSFDLRITSKLALVVRVLRNSNVMPDRAGLAVLLLLHDFFSDVGMDYMQNLSSM